MTTAADFWSNVEVGGGNGCWLWLGSKNPKGYGRAFFGKPHLAHRLAWTLSNGPIPDGLCVCHRCDVRHCINPAHLFIGTQAENVGDMDAKGRRGRFGLRGSSQPMSKLTESDVIDIRRLLALGITQTWIGRAYGVTNGAIFMIASGKNWTQVRGDCA